MMYGSQVFTKGTRDTPSSARRLTVSQTKQSQTYQTHRARPRVDVQTADARPPTYSARIYTAEHTHTSHTLPVLHLWKQIDHKASRASPDARVRVPSARGRLSLTHIKHAAPVASAEARHAFGSRGPSIALIVRAARGKHP